MRDKKNQKFSGSSLLRYFMKGSRRYFAASVLFGWLVSLADLLNPKIIEYTVDSVIGKKPLKAPAYIRSFLNGAGGIAALRSHLWRIALAVGIVALIGAVSRYLFKLYNEKGAERLVERTRNELYGHIMELPYSWHSRNHTGDIIQRCTSDVETVKTFVAEHLMTLLRVLILIVMSMVFMFRIHTRLALIAGLFIPLMVASSIFFYSRIGSSFLKVDSEEGLLSSMAQENLTGVRVVRAFGKEAYERGRFEKQNQSYTVLWYHLQKILASFWVLQNVIATVRNLTVTAAGAVFCVQGSLTAGGFIAFISYNALISLPVRSIGRVITEMSKAGISIDRLAYIMNAEPEKDAPGDEETPLDGDIRFEHVCYRYPDSGGEVLEDVDFEIPAGSSVGILGETGSGKTTLAALLDRLYDLPEGCGRITIGGTDIRKIKRRYLRSQIGMVLQEPYLFSRTLTDNIRVARSGADVDDVKRAAHIASLDDAIRHFADGYDTFVGERGVTLSGGQKQRTAIAQMLVRKPPIMVFDDSLSAVDAETDAKIRRRLEENRGSATVILIAHRITTLMHADQILVLENGRIIERGTHAELMEKRGRYYQIAVLQSRGADEKETDAGSRAADGKESHESET